MNEPAETRTLLIKKYPNRRLYDQTRSQHVGMAEIHDLVGRGYDVQILDSATGSDITTAVLLQIILEKESDKLAIFPAAILHQIIRTQRQFLGGVVEQFFRQSIETQRAAQEQWSRFLERTFGVRPPPVPTTPADWTRAVMDAVTLGSKRQPPTESPPPADRDEPAAPVDQTDVDELRRQLADLAKRIESLTSAREKPSAPADSSDRAG